MENNSQHFPAALAAQPAPVLLWAFLVSGRCELPVVPTTSCALQARGLWGVLGAVLGTATRRIACAEVFTGIPKLPPLRAQAVIARQLTGIIYCLLVLTMQTLPGFASLYFASLFGF